MRSRGLLGYTPLGRGIPVAQQTVAEGGDRREHEVAGLTGFRHRVFGLADLIQPGSWQPGLGLGSVTTDSLPAGPGGVTLACV
jgi:hypothetical protein